MTIHELCWVKEKQMHIKENTSNHPGKNSLGVGRYAEARGHRRRRWGEGGGKVRDEKADINTFLYFTEKISLK